MYWILFPIEVLLAAAFLLPFVASWEYKILRSTMDIHKEKDAIDRINETITKPGATYDAITNHLSDSFDNTHLTHPSNRWWCVATNPNFSLVGKGPTANTFQLSAREETMQYHSHGSVQTIKEMHIVLMELMFYRDVNLPPAKNNDGENALSGLILEQLLENGIWKSVSANEILELDPKAFLVYVDSLVEVDHVEKVVLKTLYPHNYNTLVANLSRKAVKVPAIEDDSNLDYFLRNMDGKEYDRIDTRSLLAMALLKQYLMAGKSTREMMEKLTEIATEAEKLKDKYPPRELKLVRHIATKPEKLFKALEIADVVMEKPDTNDFKLLTEAYEISDEVDILVKNKALHKFMSDTAEFVKSIVRHIVDTVMDKSKDEGLAKQKKFGESIVKYIVKSKSGSNSYERKPVPAEYAPSGYVHWKAGIPKPCNDSMQEALTKNFEASKGYFAVVNAVSNTLISSSSYTTKFTLKSPCSKIVDTSENSSCKKYFGDIQISINKMMSVGKLKKADLAKGIVEWAVRAYDAFEVHLKNGKSEQSKRKEAVKNAKELIFTLLDDSPSNRRKKEGFFGGVNYLQ